MKAGFSKAQLLAQAILPNRSAQSYPFYILEFALVANSFALLKSHFERSERYKIFGGVIEVA
jgi:hypothetical protein